MMVAGELDAMVSPLPPSCFTGGHPDIGRLFPDFRSLEKAYWNKTGVFPIMHVAAIRRSLVEEHRWLANNVFEAFEKAKKMVMPGLRNFGAVKATVPWLAAEVEETIALMGEDYWPYGASATSSRSRPWALFPRAGAVQAPADGRRAVRAGDPGAVEELAQYPIGRAPSPRPSPRRERVVRRAPGRSITRRPSIGSVTPPLFPVPVPRRACRRACARRP